MIGVGTEEEEMKDMNRSPLRCAVEHSEDPELAEGVKQSARLVRWMKSDMQQS